MPLRSEIRPGASGEVVASATGKIAAAVQGMGRPVQGEGTALLCRGAGAPLSLFGHRHVGSSLPRLLGLEFIQTLTRLFDALAKLLDQLRYQVSALLERQ